MTKHHNGTGSALLQVHLPRTLRLLLILAVVGALNAVSLASAAGTNYYIDSVAGSDSNSGTSEASPWKSLSNAQKRSFQPGDTINLKRGSSWSAKWTLSSSGASGNPITIKAYGTSASPVISYTGDDVLNISGSYWVIQDVLLRDAGTQAIYIQPGVSNTVIQNVEITASGMGIDTRGSNTLITRNYIHDLKMAVNNGASTDYGAEGISVDNGASNTEISYNRFVNCRAPSTAFGYDGGIVEFWQNSDNTNVHHNYSTGSNGWVEVGGGTVSNVTIAYNVSDRDYGAFSCIHTQGQFYAPIRNFKVENNTIIRTDGFKWSVLDWDNGSAPSQFYFRNNLVYSNTHQVSLSTSFTHSNNLYYLYGGSVLGFSLNSSEKQADPKFVNFNGGDYHLQAGSPAIDAAANLGYTTDFDDKALPGNSGPDMGAYELGTTSLASTATPPAPAEALTMSQPLFTAGPGPAPEYRYGFKTLSDLLGGLTGAAVENERHDPDNGDGLQQTTGGLMVWRKADNWTAFTNGYWTWVNGPLGLQDRPNTARFGWEAAQ